MVSFEMTVDNADVPCDGQTLITIGN